MKTIVFLILIVKIVLATDGFLENSDFIHIATARALDQQMAKNNGIILLVHHKLF